MRYIASKTVFMVGMCGAHDYFAVQEEHVWVIASGGHIGGRNESQAFTQTAHQAPASAARILMASCYLCWLPQSVITMQNHI